MFCNEKLGMSSDKLGAGNLLHDCFFDGFKQNKMKPLCSERVMMLTWVHTQF